MSGTSGASNGESEADDVMRRLLEEFGARLDESLIYAIASDHDIRSSYDDIRNLLLPLADSVLAEEATGFDPSGLGYVAEFAGLHFDDAATEDTTPVSLSSTTELTADISEASDGVENAPFTDQVDLSEDDKIDSLRMIFPNFKSHTIKFVLKQAAGDVERAFDDLLSRQFLHESGDLAKGVDGFYLPYQGTPRRRGDKTAQPKTRANKLQVDYSVKLDLPDVDELEGARGAVKLQPRPGRAQSPRLSAQVLAVKPPYPRTAVVSSSENRPTQRAQLAWNQNRDAPRPAESAWQVVSKRQRTARREAADSMPTSAVSNANVQAAAALYRKGASNPLYRQAAAVYAERAREDARAAHEAASAAHERLVDSQSTPYKIDLHGIPVLDGVRIAKARVWRWWKALALGERGEPKEATTYGFTVVTGVGYHSAGGVSRMRQAVHAALTNDGWRMQILTGEFLITGRG